MTTTVKQRRWNPYQTIAKNGVHVMSMQSMKSDPAKKKKPSPLPKPKDPPRPVIARQVAEVFETYFHLPVDQYTPGSVFATDLGADELDIVEVLMALEEKFDVSLEALEGERDPEELTVGHVLEALVTAGAKLT